jgi:hypothetical protein
MEEENQEQIKTQETTSCCSTQEIQNTSDRPKGFWSGLMYGLIPHTGCIAFIIFTILGVSTATAFFKPLLMSRYFFHGLIALSFVFATISAIIYLKKANLLSLEGMKRKWKYLSVLYGTSIGINLILFLLIFPMAANLTSGSPTGAVSGTNIAEITLKVDIPCPGHAPLISEELKTINGVNLVKFKFPNYFDVKYDSSITSQKEIFSLEVFEEYPAKLISGDSEIQNTPPPTGCSSCGSCSGACGGSCGG